MIEVDQLTKNYGSTAAIKDVSFTVEPGEILGFLGPNGAGKTTTMRILTGYLPATEGTARVAGKDVHADSMAVRQSIGYLPETPPLYPEMTVEGFLYFVARIKGVSPGDLAAKVTSAIERCNLQEKRSVIIRKLSKGFRQRVGIAQAIVHNPPVIVLDEPTVGLDPRQIIEVRNLIKSLAGEHTIILSTHILPEVSATCDRITIINQGQIVATDSPEHLVARLTGQGGYAVELSGQSERGLAVLQAVPGVTQVAPLAAEDLPEGHQRFQVTTGSEDLGSAIAQAVVNQGLGLFELTRRRASLEDVFINLTMQDAAPEATGSTDPVEKNAEKSGDKSGDKSTDVGTTVAAVPAGKQASAEEGVVAGEGVVTGSSSAAASDAVASAVAADRKSVVSKALGHDAPPTEASKAPPLEALKTRSDGQLESRVMGPAAESQAEAMSDDPLSEEPNP